jgi:hypothetical protein
MQELVQTKLNLLASQSNKTPREAVEIIFQNMPVRPLYVGNEFTSYSAPLTTVFDTYNRDTRAISELNKIALSAASALNGYIYVTGDNSGGETLEVLTAAQSTIPKVTAECENLLDEAGDAILAENGDNIVSNDLQGNITFTDYEIMEGSKFSNGTHICNRVTSVSYPRELEASATSVLWKLYEPQSLAAGESITFRGQYNGSAGEKVNGTDFVTPVSGTDFAAFANSDGTGTNYTANMSVAAEFGSAEVEARVTNTHATDTFIFGGPSIPLQVRGRIVRTSDPVTVIEEDAASIALYGEFPLKVDLAYQRAPSHGTTEGEAILTFYSDPITTVDRLQLWANRDPLSMLKFLYCEPNFSCFVTESMTGLSNSLHRLVGYEFEIQGDNVFWYPTFKPI